MILPALPFIAILLGANPAAVADTAITVVTWLLIGYCIAELVWSIANWTRSIYE